MENITKCSICKIVENNDKQRFNIIAKQKCIDCGYERTDIFNDSKNQASQETEIVSTDMDVEVSKNADAMEFLNSSISSESVSIDPKQKQIFILRKIIFQRNLNL